MHKSHYNLLCSKETKKTCKSANITPIIAQCKKYIIFQKSSNTVISDADLSTRNLLVKTWLMLKWKCEWKCSFSHLLIWQWKKMLNMLQGEWMINKRITALSIFKMEGCFLLTGGQPCRDRSEEEEDNKDIDITKGKYKRLETRVWLPAVIHGFHKYIIISHLDSLFLTQFSCLTSTVLPLPQSTSDGLMWNWLERD